MTQRKPNHLAEEKSPYLRQHAHNPVNWRPWGAEALRIAREQNKLLVISIGYSACHWCHVMEHESFSDEEVAEAMNRDFISVKVDREERPDVDQVYMNAAMATTGRGGWPLNVIALPDQRPLFAGTYYRKADWLEILAYFSGSFKRRPSDLLDHAEELEKSMQRHLRLPPPVGGDASSLPAGMDAWTACRRDIDPEHGGTAGAPKFPMPVALGLMLRTAVTGENAEAASFIRLTLDRIARGGINDQLGGGFCRYSVDGRWQVPHFEKMLYDNAQLITLYSDAYSAFRSEEYRQTAEQTIAFVLRELGSPEGLFMASLDADSEGEEGRFYTWTAEEIRRGVCDRPELVSGYFSIREEGNRENGLNVLRRETDDNQFAISNRLSTGELQALVGRAKEELMQWRNRRVRPATDEKILTGWNGLMITALARAAAVFGRREWLDAAARAAGLYVTWAGERNGRLWRNLADGKPAGPAFLDDYAFLTEAFLTLHRCTADNRWLEAALGLTDDSLQHYSDPGGVFFRLTPDDEPPLVQPVLELSDNVIPSSNSQTARNLLWLGRLAGREDLTRRAVEMARRMRAATLSNPWFHANWAHLLDDLAAGPPVLSFAGPEAESLRAQMLARYLPGVIFADEPAGEGITVCAGNLCHPAVPTVAEATGILRSLPLQR